jgi:hypothetical protein
MVEADRRIVEKAMWSPWSVDTITAVGVLVGVGILWEINLKLKAIHFMMKDDFDKKHGLGDD